MKIVMITRLYSPHVGGVEKHTENLIKFLVDKGIKTTIFTERYEPTLKSRQKIKNCELIRIGYPKIKFLGIFFIWLKLLKNVHHILEADLIHIQDVFIWYLPFRLLLFFKPVYTTFHGWEGNYPISKISILQKQIANELSTGTIAVGDYIGKYYKFIPTFVIYGGTECKEILDKSKAKKNLIFLGRLDKDTGLNSFLKFLDKNPSLKSKTIFIGDGTHKHLCKLYGEVKGSINPDSFLKIAKVVVTSGYLSILESFARRVKVYVCPNNPLKQDYYYLSPFTKYLNYLNDETTRKEFDHINQKIIDEAFLLSKNYTWRSIYDSYLRLWNIS